LLSKTFTDLITEKGELESNLAGEIEELTQIINQKTKGIPI
jgi:hypothetical protein